MDSETIAAFISIYDALPPAWEDSRVLLVERIKEIGNQINRRQIGYFPTTQYPAGKLYPPGVNTQEFRDVLRKVINCSPLAIGLNTFAHGIAVDSNFTLTQLYAAATQTAGFTSIPIPNGASTITMDATNIYITVASAYTRAFAVIEWIGEL